MITIGKQTVRWRAALLPEEALDGQGFPGADRCGLRQLAAEYAPQVRHLAAQHVAHFEKFRDGTQTSLKASRYKHHLVPFALMPTHTLHDFFIEALQRPRLPGREPAASELHDRRYRSSGIEPVVTAIEVLARCPLAQQPQQQACPEPPRRRPDTNQPHHKLQEAQQRGVIYDRSVDVKECITAALQIPPRSWLLLVPCGKYRSARAKLPQSIFGFARSTCCLPEDCALAKVWIHLISYVPMGT